MNQNISKEKYFLLFLVNADKSQTKLIFKIMNKPQTEAVCAIVYNIIHGTFKLKRETRETVEGVRGYRKQFYNIVDKKLSSVKRKELMVRRSHELIILLRVAVKEIFAKHVR